MNNRKMTSELNKIDKTIERTLRAFYDHARRKTSYLEAKRSEGLSEQDAEAAWIKDLESFRAALDAAYRELKDYIYPRKV